MRACPSCGEPGILEHSVLVPLASLVDGRAASRQQPSTFARCVRCAAVFLHPDPATLVPQATETLDGQTVWLVPPWKARTNEAAFEASWDIVQAFFEKQAVDVDWVQPLFGLVSELRAAGLDARLRAGQSLNSLGLSRAREHGLRPEQSHLFLSPQPDGSILIEGLIRGTQVRHGPVAPGLDDSLRALIDELLAAPID